MNRIESRALPHTATLGMVATVAGAFILLRWSLNLELFNGLLGNALLMMPWTAVGFLLLGLSLWIQGRESRRLDGPSRNRQRLAMGCAGVVIALAVHAQIELVTGWTSGLDLVLFTDTVVARSKVAPGQMSAIVAIVQSLLGLSLLSMSWPVRSGLAAVPALLAIVAGLTGMVGRLYGASTLFSIAGHSTVSWPTALLFLVVGVGSLGLQPDQAVLAPFMKRHSGGAMGRRLLPAVIAVPILLGWIRLQLQLADWYGLLVGLTIYTCSNIITFALLIWWTARLLNSLDEEREAIEHRARAALAESESRYRTLAESLPQLIWTCRADGWCDYLSPQWIAYTGVPEAESLGSAWSMSVHPEDLQQVSAQWAWTVKSGEPFDVEFRIRRHDGRYRWFRTLAMPARDASGRVIKWYGSNTDIDDRKRAEAELQALTAALEQRVEERTAQLKAAKELAESADRLKTDFITTMSHELRTPLNSIIGFTGTLLSGMPGPLNASQDQQLRIVQSSGRNLLLLINDVLDVARIESGASEYTEAPVDVRQLIRSVAAEQAALAEGKGLALTTRLGDTPLVLYTDERALRQILSNLVNNAIKFTSHGAIEIKVSTGWARGARRIELAVCDSGIGIATEHLSRLFMKFSRLHEAHDSVAGGTGLGLYLSQLLADRLGAAIEVESELGKGSCFTVCFPESAAQRASQ